MVREDTPPEESIKKSRSCERLFLYFITNVIGISGSLVEQKGDINYLLCKITQNAVPFLKKL